MISENGVFTPEEKERYHRHFILNKIGIRGQTYLKKAKILVIGAGGLGCPVLQYLAAAGVGTIGIVDNDNVELSNLQRQILFTVNDIGINKAVAAKNRLAVLNPNIQIETYDYRLTKENALTLLARYDVVVDGSDNFPTRYLVNDACVLLKKPLVYGAISQFEGQIAVFNQPLENGRFSANYRDIFPNPPAPNTIKSCSVAGVLGVLPGMIGLLQANEAIKLIIGIGTPLIDKILLIDALDMSFRTLKIKKNIDLRIEKLIDYDFFCNAMLYEISLSEFQALENYQLVDVRTSTEHELNNIGGISIPLDSLLTGLQDISKDKKVILYCASGFRSVQAVLLLREQGFDNAFSLENGLKAFSKR